MPELAPLRFELLGDDGDVVRLRAMGCLSDPQYACGESPLEAACGADGYRRKVLVDLNYVDFIDSSGIGWLLGCLRRFRAAGGAFVLHTIPPVVSQTLKVLHMDKVFPVAKDEQEARALARGEMPT